MEGAAALQKKCSKATENNISSTVYYFKQSYKGMEANDCRDLKYSLLKG